MKKIYIPKDLGYPRELTAAMIRVTFSNGEQWDVPAQIVADSRDENYKDEKEDTILSIRQKRLDNYDLIDWFTNNMNWSDVAKFAKKVRDCAPIDYEDELCDCYKSVCGEL